MRKPPPPILPGFRIFPAESANDGHWQGGPNRYVGAECPICNNRLLTLIDFDRSDPRFSVHGRFPLGHLNRFPLLFCFRCLGDLFYRVAGPKVIDVLHSEGNYQGDDFPYRRFPKQFVRKPIQLEALAELPTKLKRYVSTGLLSEIPVKGRKLVSRWLGRPAKRGFDIWWHQFGGHPYLFPGDWDPPQCRNANCPRSRGRSRMIALAAIHNDPPSGFPMFESMRDVRKADGKFNSLLKIGFFACRRCLSICAMNRCD